MELWNGIKNEIEIINCGKAGKNGKQFLKIKFGTDNDLRLNKLSKFQALKMIVRSVLKRIVNFFRKFIYISVFMSYKNAAVRKN